MKQAFYAMILVCFFTLTAHAQEKTSVIEVTGMSTAEELPQELSVNIPLIVIDTTYLSCSNRLNKLLTELKKDLESRGIEGNDFSTGNYSISENFEFKQGERKRAGFKGQVNLTLKKQYEPGLVDGFLQAAEKFSLQYTVRFLLSEEQKEKLSATALVQAVNDAKQKAQVLADAAGVQLGSVSEISYGEFQGRPGPLTEVVRMSADGAGMDSNGLKLYPGPISVNQTVRIVWRISQ